MHLDLRSRQLLIAELGAGIATLLPLLTSTESSSAAGDDNSEELMELYMRVQHMLEHLQPTVRPGRGRTLLGQRLSQLSLPSQKLYERALLQPDTVFPASVRFTPAEFEELHSDVLEVLESARFDSSVFTTEQNRLRKRRRFKFSSRERLFHFLCFVHEYPTFRSMASRVGLIQSAFMNDFVWLREQLSTHPVLVAEVHWPAPQELEKQRKALVRAGLLPPGFEEAVFMCDGTKDLSRRKAHYFRLHEPDYSQKGNGKSHLLVANPSSWSIPTECHVYTPTFCLQFTDLFGGPMMLCSGIQGNENDPGAYALTPIFRDPSNYLLENHNGLFDGVFQGAVHCNTSKVGILPTNAPQLKRAAPARRKELKRTNKIQRYLRCPIEQTFGHIKQWGLVSDTVWRGDTDQQGLNMLLCTQLSGRLMRVRNRYPRGDKWMVGTAEEWENEWNREGWLYRDPLHPELYEEWVEG